MAGLARLFSVIVALFRLGWLGLHFFSGFILLFTNRILWGKQWFYSERGANIVKQWMWRGSRILGLDIKIKGEPSVRSTVIVANHISWLDIVALAATVPVTIVSKSDLARWPVIGGLAKLSGTIFIERGNLFAMHKTLSAMTEIALKGRRSLFFPEGTTTRGKSVNKFHSGLFAAAYATNSPVQPVAIRYFNGEEADHTIAPYVDDDHFLRHLWRGLLQAKIHVQLDFLELVDTENRNRQHVAQVCQQRIAAHIQAVADNHANYPADVKDAGYVLLN